jgi:hypothetical protein
MANKKVPELLTLKLKQQEKEKNYVLYLYNPIAAGTPFWRSHLVVNPSGVR